MKTKTYNTYKFEELSEESQQKAIENLYDINVDYDWYEWVYKDAKNIGLKIEAFDLDRASYVKGRLTLSPRECMLAIIKEHGKDGETHKDAVKYLAKLDALDLDSKDYDDQFEDLVTEFIYDLKEDYLIILTKEYEYLTSKEAIIEIIKSNDYDFTVNGKID